MSLWNLAKRSLSFYWRTSLGVLLAVMVSAIVLTGALVIGDSVRYSLQSMVKARLGETQLALIPINRFFRAELANDIAKELGTVAAPVLQLRGLIANSDGDKQANRIEVLGVDGRFFEIGTAQNPLRDIQNQGIILNIPLAEKLGVGAGDEVVLRIEKPSLMPRDVPLTPDSDLSMAFRLVVIAIADKSDFGSFSLKANHITSLNAFVPLQWLQKQLGRSNEANMLLLAANAGDDITTEKANEAVKKCWQLADAGLELHRLQNKDMFELRSKRVFIDESITAAANTGDESFGVLSYFVNEISSGDKATPYSMVAAVSQPADAGGLIPEGMQNNEILINQWLAGDLCDVAEEIVSLGINSVAFDYIRFPTDGDLGRIALTGITGPRWEPLLSFLQKIEERLGDSVEIGICVFGFAVWQPLVREGQVIEKMGDHIDILYPMLYPSHFGRNFKREVNEYWRNYWIYHDSVREALKKLPASVRVIPFVQAFDYLAETFDNSYVSAQMGGALAAGAHGVALWHAGGDYAISWEPLSWVRNLLLKRAALMNLNNHMKAAGLRYPGTALEREQAQLKIRRKTQTTLLPHSRIDNPPLLQIQRTYLDPVTP